MYSFIVAARLHTMMVRWEWPLNTFRPSRNGRHFADDTFNCIFVNENIWMSIRISLQFVSKGPINNIPAMVLIMAWRLPGDKPLSEPIMARSLTHVCVTRPPWVNTSRQCYIYHLMYCRMFGVFPEEVVFTYWKAPCYLPAEWKLEAAYIKGHHFTSQCIRWTSNMHTSLSCSLFWWGFPLSSKGIRVIFVIFHSVFTSTGMVIWSLWCQWGSPEGDGRYRWIVSGKWTEFSNAYVIRFYLWWPSDDMSALVQTMVWCRPGDKSLSDPKITRFTDEFMPHRASISAATIIKVVLYYACS